MYRKQLILALIVFCGFSLFVPEMQAQKSKEVAEKIKRNHVNLVALGKQGVNYAASGIAISSTQILSCAHIMDDSTGVLYNNIPGIIIAQEYDLNNILTDFIVIEFPGAHFDPKIKLGTTSIGEHVYAYTHTLGIKDLFQEYTLSKIEGNEIIISPGPNMGASGSGVYNEKSELVGMIVASSLASITETLDEKHRPYLQTVDGGGLGIVIHINLLKKFISKK